MNPLPMTGGNTGISMINTIPNAPMPSHIPTRYILLGNMFNGDELNEERTFFADLMDDVEGIFLFKYKNNHKS